MQTDEQLLQGELLNPKDTDFIRCPERAIPYWRIEMIISMLWMSFAIAVLVFLIAILWKDATAWWFLLCAANLPLAVWYWFREKTAWRIRGYHLGPEQIWVRSGIGTRRLVSAPYGRIQNCDVNTTFWSRKFNLASVTVNTGARSSMHIYDIDPADAARIRDLLTDIALNKGVQL